VIFLTISYHQNPEPTSWRVRVKNEAEGVIQVSHLNNGTSGGTGVCETNCTAPFQNLLTHNLREKFISYPVTCNLSTLTACKPELVEPLQPR
jgi:hypothetical protein